MGWKGCSISRIARPSHVSVAMTRCRSVCANDHSPPTDTSTVPAGIAATRSSVAAQVRSSVAQAARRPSGSPARRSARPGKRRLSSASTSGITSTPLTRKKLSPSKSHGASMSAPATSTARITTPDRSALTNRAPRRSASTNSAPCRSSDRVKVAMTSPCRAPSRVTATSSTTSALPWPPSVSNRLLRGRACATPTPAGSSTSLASSTPSTAPSGHAGSVTGCRRLSIHQWWEPRSTRRSAPTHLWRLLPCNDFVRSPSPRPPRSAPRTYGPWARDRATWRLSS